MLLIVSCKSILNTGVTTYVVQHFKHHEREYFIIVKLRAILGIQNKLPGSTKNDPFKKLMTVVMKNSGSRVPTRGVTNVDVRVG